MFGGCQGGCPQAAAPIAAAPCAAPVAIAPPCSQNTAVQQNLPPRFQQSADCSNRYSQQTVDNNNHIYVTQPVINERNHHVNHLNRTLIRDNNYHHYRVNNLYRDNVINRQYNQVFRTSRNFCDYSCTQGRVQGTCTSTPPVNTYHTLPSCGPCGASAPVAPAPAPCGPCGAGRW